MCQIVLAQSRDAFDRKEPMDMIDLATSMCQVLDELQEMGMSEFWETGEYLSEEK